jgi:hypothetical protein
LELGRSIVDAVAAVQNLVLPTFRENFIERKILTIDLIGGDCGIVFIDGHRSFDGSRACLLGLVRHLDWGVNDSSQGGGFDLSQARLKVLKMKKSQRGIVCREKYR